MTGPSGDQPRGFWDIVEAEPPHRLVFVDGFANDDGTPNDDFPRNEGRVTIEPIDAGRTRMSIESHFPSTEAMEQVLGDGHGGGPDPGRRPDRRDPRRGCRPLSVSRASTTRRPTMTTMTEPTTHTLDAPGAVLTYDVRQADSTTAPGAAPDRIADGRRRVRHAGRATSPIARS